MKEIKLTFSLILILLFETFGQSKPFVDSSLKNEIIELEKAAWKAWQEKNATWFQNNATDECLWVTQGGVSNKVEWVKTGASACDVKSYSFDSFQLLTLNKNAVVITYTATVEATCGNFKLPSKMRASVSYVKRNRKWQEAFYMEMPISD